MATSRDLRVMEDNILAGRREMQAGKYKAAIVAFRKVSCPTPTNRLTPNSHLNPRSALPALVHI